MNQPPPETLFSVPLGLLAAWLLVMLVGAAEIALWVVWRLRRRAPAAPADPLAAPWLPTLLGRFRHGALVVDEDGRPVAWNQAGRVMLAEDEPQPELPLALLTLVLQVLGSRVEQTTEILDDQAHPLQVAAIPLDHSGVLVLSGSSAQVTGSVQSYRHLISAMAHELRTPLTAIVGHADILSSCHPVQDEALWRRSCSFIAAEAERLARLVEDLLTLSRLDLAPLQRRSVNLRAVAEEAVSALFRAAEARGVQIALQSTPDLPRVSGDRDRLYQVLTNLVDNAVKYTPAGGQVTVRLTAVETGAQVEVCDSGIGISPTDQEHLFEPFFRAQDARSIPGTGLGLAIVHTILRQHDVDIRVQSAPGQGTTFSFCLPYT